MATYREKAIHLVVLSIGVGAMFIASFASYAHFDFANAQSNNRTSMQPQGVTQSTQGVQNTTTKNYTGLEEKNKALVLKAFDTLFNNRDYVAARAIGHPNTSSIVLSSLLVATACSTSSRTVHQH